jgi:hypothetical protein
VHAHMDGHKDIGTDVEEREEQEEIVAGFE